MENPASKEADRNYDAFMAALPKIPPEHRGKHALLHQGEIIDYFDSPLSATLAGFKKFGEGAFSVQEVNPEPEHLGFYSYVGGAGPN